MLEFTCEINHWKNSHSAQISAVQIKSPINAEMIMALMSFLLISTSAITWPAERLSPDNNASVVDEVKLQRIVSLVNALKLKL